MVNVNDYTGGTGDDLIALTAINIQRTGGMKNVRVSNIISAGGEVVESNCFE